MPEELKTLKVRPDTHHRVKLAATIAKEKLADFASNILDAATTKKAAAKARKPESR